MLKSMQCNWLHDMCESHNTVPTDLHGEHSAARFEIYRTSWQANMGNAMADTYPVIKKLVGTDFFQAMVHRYIVQYPSRYGDIHLYGDNFAKFLREFSPVRELVYLPEVARLEWMIHQVFHAADAPVINISHLASLSMSQLEMSRVQLHPGLRLLQSDFPVHDIWRVNQDGLKQQSVIDLDTGSVNLMVFRQALNIVLLPLPLIEYQFIQRLQRTGNISMAYEQTLQKETEFNMAGMLHCLFGYQLVSEFTTINDKP